MLQFSRWAEFLLDARQTGGEAAEERGDEVGDGDHQEGRLLVLRILQVGTLEQTCLLLSSGARLIAMMSHVQLQSVHGANTMANFTKIFIQFSYVFITPITGLFIQN